MGIHKSGEDYLKVIYLLHQKKGEVRECDIAEVMGYSKASVCNMVKALTGQGYVTHFQHDVQLTELGLQTAQAIHKKYCITKEFMVSVLQIQAATAEKDACHLEHILSDETIRALQDQLTEKGAAENGTTICPFMDKGL